MMLFADESVDRAIVERLRHDGHDTLYVAELSPSITDDEVLREAAANPNLEAVHEERGGILYRVH